MNKRRRQFAPGVSFAHEILESRVALSGTGLPHGAAEVATQVVRNTPTTTTVAVHAGTLGQPVTFTVTVRGAASAGAPQGTVTLTDHGQTIQTLTLSPASSTNGRFAYSQASYTFTPQPGGPAYFFGRHSVNAVFTPSGAFGKSRGGRPFNVAKPAYTTLSDGVKIASIAPGAGPAIQSGQTASLLYTGYLASNGHIFDDSINHGGAPISFKLGAGQVIPGFDAGTVGMQVGETRIISIPPAQGYGRTATGPIPANSTLIFVVTLVGIS